MERTRKNLITKCISALLLMVLLCGLAVPAFAKTGTVETQAVSVAASKKYIFIGDSRTANLRQSQLGGSLVYDLLQQDGNVLWDFKWGAHFSDLTTNLVPRLEMSGLDTIDSKTKIIVWMGYNDAVGVPTATVNDYINYYNLMTALWVARGASVYIVNVGPAGRKKTATTAQKAEYKEKNKKIRAFNKSLKNGLSADAHYIDIYANLIETDYATSDGTHYVNVTSRGIYKYVLSKVK